LDSLHVIWLFGDDRFCDGREQGEVSVCADRRGETTSRLVALALVAPLPTGSRVRDGQTGSLVVYDGAAWRGRDVWVAKRKGTGRVIAPVREWEVDGVRVLAAVFPCLRAGTYRVCEMDRGELGRSAEVLIDAGQIVALDWSSPAGDGNPRPA